MQTQSNARMTLYWWLGGMTLAILLALAVNSVFGSVAAVPLFAFCGWDRSRLAAQE